MRLNSFTLLFVTVLFAALPLHADVCGSTKGNLVKNCGFETGTFGNWTLTGPESGPLYSGFSYEIDNFEVHSGSYDASLGGFSSVLDMTQAITTTRGTSYSISFWLGQDAPGTNSFSLSFGGQTLLSNQNVAQTSLLPYTVQATASTNKSSLVFGFYDTGGSFFIDDISVVANAPTVPEPASAGFAGLGLALAASLAGWRRAIRSASPAEPIPVQS